MKKLAEIILSLLNLFEAEGRLLRFRALDTARNFGLLFLGLLLAIAALVFFLGAFYQFLSIYLTPPLVLCLMGIASAMAAIPLLVLPCRKKK